VKKKLYAKGRSKFRRKILCFNSVQHTKIFVASVRFCNRLCQAVCSYEADLLLTYFTDETILTVTSILKITYTGRQIIPGYYTIYYVRAVTGHYSPSTVSFQCDKNNRTNHHQNDTSNSFTFLHLSYEENEYGFVEQNDTTVHIANNRMAALRHIIGTE
jgi:hypothetical protein